MHKGYFKLILSMTHGTRFEINKGKVLFNMHFNVVYIIVGVYFFSLLLMSHVK